MNLNQKKMQFKDLCSKLETEQNRMISFSSSPFTCLQNVDSLDELEPRRGFLGTSGSGKAFYMGKENTK